mmetsp:Transcript_15560/g.29373  ORF Transcript_15560/g.29373 Transcript_15560/m.29373 type:complete len:268 (-) Transcript_15560:316-1119(-)
MLRRCNTVFLKLDIDVIPVNGNGAHQVARDPRAISGVKLHHEVQKRVKMASRLVIDVLVLLAWAILEHLFVRDAWLAVVVEENPIEHSELRQSLLPSSLHNVYSGFVSRPMFQSFQNHFGALDDGVRARLKLLNPARAVATAKAHLQNIAVGCNLQLVNALLHVGLLPFHHHLETVRIKQLLFSISVEGEEKAISPVLKLQPRPIGGRFRQRLIKLDRLDISLPNCRKGAQAPSTQASVEAIADAPSCWVQLAVPDAVSGPPVHGAV